MNGLPVACDLSEAALAERRSGLLALATPDVLAAVTKFIRLESQC
jgi:hypothetical protein